MYSIEEEAGIIEGLKLLYRRLDREVNPVEATACEQLLAEILQRMEQDDYEATPEQQEVSKADAANMSVSSQHCKTHTAASTVGLLRQADRA